LSFIPFAMFLLLKDPHDCFKCLGKDPDRVFSKFQLTKAEQQFRLLELRLGTKRAMEVEQMLLTDGFGDGHQRSNYAVRYHSFMRSKFPESD